MKQEPMLDWEIKKVLHSRVDSLDVSAEAESRILAEISKLQSEKQVKESYKMKKFSVKLGVTVSAVACLSCMTALAASGIINGWAGHNIVGTETGNFAEVEENLVPQLEFQPALLEDFSNGFAFEQAHLGSTTALDENNERVGKNYTELYMKYLNAETDEVVNLCYDNIPEVAAEPLPGAPEIITRVVDDVVLSYQAMPYKFVPVDYELTEEDKAALESGAVEISYGADTVEEKTACGVTWTVDGVDHFLFGWDLELGADGMLDMAEELLPEEESAE